MGFNISNEEYMSGYTFGNMDDIKGLKEHIKKILERLETLSKLGLEGAELLPVKSSRAVLNY